VALGVDAVHVGVVADGSVVVSITDVSVSSSAAWTRQNVVVGHETLSVNVFETEGNPGIVFSVAHDAALPGSFDTV
jgi:hypothetical protein